MKKKNFKKSDVVERKVADSSFKRDYKSSKWLFQLQ